MVIITTLLSFFLAFIFWHILAKYNRKRILNLEKHIERITADALPEQINLNEWPKELKDFGKKFNTMLGRIQTSFTQLSRFSSDIAHELMTPISHLKGITELALAKEELSNENRQVLESHLKEYHHLSKLIETLLFLARYDHGQLILRKEVINTRYEILKICDHYQAIADENSIVLTCTGDAEIIADPTLFRQVISHLISNALKYTKPIGHITINIKSTDQHVQISIQDTGTGISAEHLMKVFDRFYRVDASRSSPSGSLGLGLAIVKSIIELHKGKITIESKLNRGTSVYLQLPSPL